MTPRQRIIVAQPQHQGEQRRKILVEPSVSFDSDSTTSTTSSDNSTATAGKPLINNSNNNNNNSKDEETNEAYMARTCHDHFNLVALLFVVGTFVIDWDFGKLMQGYTTEAFRDSYFLLNWTTTMLYFLVDLVWVSLVPISVKSPDVIVKHHLISMVYLMSPIVWPEYRWFMGACLSVEINTWFLILRRILYKSREKRSFPPLLNQVVSISFYVSWIIIRVFLYPAMLAKFLMLAHEAIVETGRYLHGPMICIPVHFFLCVLNLKWTFDLFAPIVRDWMAPASGSAKSHAVVVSSGL